MQEFLKGAKDFSQLQYGPFVWFPVFKGGFTLFNFKWRSNKKLFKNKA
jgi:hypothetical protein